MGINGGTDTLLLYQARQRRAWHDELKAECFFNLSKLNDRKMDLFRREIDAKQNTANRQMVRILVLIHPHTC